MNTTYLERGCIELDKKKHELKILTMSHLDVANKFNLIMNLAHIWLILSNLSLFQCSILF